MRSLTRSPTAALLLALLAATPSAFAEVRAPLFTDHAVLQRGQSVPVFGQAAPGETVTVRFRDQTKTAAADAAGAWQVRLDPLAPGGPFELEIAGPGNTLRLADILVGDVWLCSGQSNMAQPVKEVPEAAALPENPRVRLNGSPGAAWTTSAPAAATEFSALCRLFGERVAAMGNVPVGLINRSVGGTEIERWLDPLTLQADPELSQKGTAKTGRDLYRTQILPLIPYALRGVLWYQGEQNAGQREEVYGPRFLGLIRHWRELWGEGDFPFLVVQLPNINPERQSVPVEGWPSWMDIRSAQLAALSLPNTAVVTTFDLGDASPHPKNKPAVADRLALAAGALTLGRKDEYMGPIFDRLEIRGNTAAAHFSHAAGGLRTRGDAPPEGFAVAGADGEFRWAEARLAGDTVMLTSPEVPRPTQARYAWANNPRGNLFNGFGLPASPFRSDSPLRPTPK